MKNPLTPKQQRTAECHLIELVRIKMKRVLASGGMDGGSCLLTPGNHWLFAAGVKLAADAMRFATDEGREEFANVETLV